SSAILTFTLNDQTINKDQKINVGNTEYINLPINESVIKTNGNDLKISFEWTNDKNDDETSQLLAIKKMEINGENINLESIDVPYISDLGRVMGYKYNNWGGTNKDLWKTWHIHTQVYERIPDFWWLRSFYYWDIPNIPFIILIILDILLIIYYFKKIVKDTSN
ncbi:MAG: hypothetical protein JW866_08025, partial [Ignavibacteriales bacterium]|nr:hypothetical protein [Ignavibacteriales bacterium]